MVVVQTGLQYAEAVAKYIAHTYGYSKSVRPYLELPFGRALSGKQRRIDILVVEHTTAKFVVIECKLQNTSGSTEDKIPSALQDLRSLQAHCPSLLVYGGQGWSSNMWHRLQEEPDTAFWAPDNTWELDHALALRFHWWDVLVGDKTHVSYPPPPQRSFEEILDMKNLFNGK